MNNLKLTTPEKNYLPLSELKGQIEWASDQRNETIIISLFWYTTGKGTQDSEVVDENVFETVTTSGKKDFLFKLPDQPYSFSGKLITLSWAIEAKVVKKIKDELEFIMAPLRTEILLINDNQG